MQQITGASSSACASPPRDGENHCVTHSLSGSLMGLVRHTSIYLFLNLFIELNYTVMSRCGGLFAASDNLSGMSVACSLLSRKPSSYKRRPVPD